MARYVMIETSMSVAINAALSAAFALLVFGGRAEIDLWGPRGLALDFAPQTFMIAFMSVLVPTAMTRRRVRAGAVSRTNGPPSRLPRNLFARALLIALAATILLGGIVTAVLAIAWHGPLGLAPVLVLKVFYGAVVALVVTPPALSAALADRD